MPITNCRVLFFFPTGDAASSYCVLDSVGQQRPRQDSEVQTVFASLPGSRILPTATAMFRCCALTSPRPDTATTPRWRAKRSYWPAPPAPSFPACPARRRQSGRRSACPPSCGWCSCGSSSAGLGSASRSSSWACSCTGPSAWPPARGSTKTAEMNFDIWKTQKTQQDLVWRSWFGFEKGEKERSWGAERYFEDSVTL